MLLDTVLEKGLKTLNRGERSFESMNTHIAPVQIPKILFRIRRTGKILLFNPP
jgi:hypothetical protein